MVLLLAACGKRSDWTVYRGTGGRGYTSNTVSPPVGVRWKLQLQEDPSGARHFNPPIVEDDTLYFGSADGNFYAMDMNSGFMKWVFPTRSPINSVPALDQDRVYFGSSDGHVYAVYRASGKEAWKYFTGNPVNSSVVASRDRIIATSDGGSTYIFTPDGVLEDQLPNFTWSYHTFQVYRDIMYFAPGPETQPFGFGTYDMERREFLWLLDTSLDTDFWYSFPAVRDDYLFYSSCGIPGNNWVYTYHTLDRMTGAELWSETRQAELGVNPVWDPNVLLMEDIRLLDYLAPAVRGDTLVYTSGDNIVRAFNANDGSTLWETDLGYPTSSAPTIAGDRVYFGLREDSEFPDIYPGALVCLSIRDGSPLWTTETEGSILNAPVIAGRWIIFGTDRNYFYVFEQVF